LSVELTTMKTHVGASNGNNLAELCSVTVEVERLRKKLEAKENAEAELLDARKAMEDMKKRLVLAESARRKLHNTVQELRGNIRVVVRVRPSLPSDLSPGDDVSPNYMPLDCQASAVKLTMNSGGENPQPLSYSFDAFDRVFAHSTEGKGTQAAVFGEVASLVQSALDGFNVCLFSYGQTGSGKTYTMQGVGYGDERGIIPRAMKQIMDSAADLALQGWEYSLEATYVEVYNENIYDLFADSQVRTNLYARIPHAEI